MYWKRSTCPVSSLKRASSSRFGPNDALRGLEDRLFDRLDEARLVDPLVLRDHLDRLKEGEVAGRSAAVGLPCVFLRCFLCVRGRRQCFLCSLPPLAPNSKTRRARLDAASGTSWTRAPSMTRTLAVGDAVEQSRRRRAPAAARAESRSLSLAFFPAKRTKSRSVRSGRSTPGELTSRLVGVGDEVGDVERGAEVARDVGAELEVDGRVARGQVAGRRAGLLHEDAQDPAAPLGLELDVDHLGPMRVHDRLDHALERVAVDAVQGEVEGGRDDCVREKGQKKTRAPVGVRVSCTNHQTGGAELTRAEGHDQALSSSGTSASAPMARSRGAGASRARRGGSAAAAPAPPSLEDDELNPAVPRAVARRDVRHEGPLLSVAAGDEAVDATPCCTSQARTASARCSLSTLLCSAVPLLSVWPCTSTPTDLRVADERVGDLGQEAERLAAG